MEQEYQKINLDNLFETLIKANGWSTRDYKDRAYYGFSSGYYVLLSLNYCGLWQKDQCIISCLKERFDLFLAALEKEFGKLELLPVKEKFKPHWVIGIAKIFANGVPDLEYELDKLFEPEGGYVGHAPTQWRHSESNFTILAKNGTVHKAVWHGEE